MRLVGLFSWIEKIGGLKVFFFIVDVLFLFYMFIELLRILVIVGV